MRNILTFAMLYLACLGTAQSQTPPTASEVAAFSPLFQAAHSGDGADILRLVAEGADVTAQDSQRRTAVHVAAFASNEDALTALALAGADMNALEYQLYDAVTIAAVANDVEMLEAAIAAGNRADLTTSVYEGTALIAAAHLGHFRVVDVLIAAGAPLDHVNNLGWTALIESVVLGDGGPDHVETARLLLEAGADPDIADRGGITPAQHARRAGFDEMSNLFDRFRP